jgi:hypothetical protein
MQSSSLTFQISLIYALLMCCSKGKLFINIVQVYIDQQLSFVVFVPFNYSYIHNTVSIGNGVSLSWGTSSVDL